MILVHYCFNNDYYDRADWVVTKMPECPVALKVRKLLLRKLRNLSRNHEVNVC